MVTFGEEISRKPYFRYPVIFKWFCLFINFSDLFVCFVHVDFTKREVTLRALSSSTGDAEVLVEVVWTVHYYAVALYCILISINIPDVWHSDPKGLRHMNNA